MKQALRITMLGLVALVGTANFAQAATNPNVVANINGKDLSKEDFDRRYKENIQIFKFSPPTKANVLNDIITFEVVVQEAKRMGLDKDPQIQERMNQVLYQALVDSQLSAKFKAAVDVSDKEARDYCRRNPAVRTSHVFVSLSPAALKAEQAAAEKKIEEARAALKGGAKFEDVVKKYSEGTTPNPGGDTGYQTKISLDPTYYMEARKLSVGGTSGVVRSQLGLHIIKLTGVQDCGKINIPDWQRMVFDEKRAKIVQDYFSELRSKAKVSINRDLVKE